METSCVSLQAEFSDGEQDTAFTSGDPALIRYPFPADLAGRAPFATEMEQFGDKFYRSHEAVLADLWVNAQFYAEIEIFLMDRQLTPEI